MSKKAAELAVDMKRKAQEADREARTFTLFTRKWAVYGQLWAEIRDKNLYQYMTPSHESFNDWRSAARIQRSTCYSYMRLHDNLPTSKVPKKIREKITSENAKVLIKLGERKRFSENFWDKAIEMSEEEFEAYCEPHIPKKGEDASGAEKQVTLSIKCYETQRAFILETLKEWAKNNELGDDYGRSLELVCAEVRSGFEKERQQLVAQLAGCFQNVHATLKGVHDEISNSELSLDDRHDKLMDTFLKVANDLNEVTQGFGEQLKLAGWVEEKKKERKAKGKPELVAKAAKTGKVPLTSQQLASIN